MRGVSRMFATTMLETRMLTIRMFAATMMVTILLLAMLPVHVDAARIRDIGQFRGMRENQLVGYGLIMGLDGTGDRKGTGFTLRSMSNLLESVGLTVSPEEMNIKNVAAVMVTASLPPFARPGGRIDVTIASIGDATSLRGGILIQTPLEGADGQVYAVAQGPVSVGGFSADSPGGTSVAQNQVTVGRIPSGAIIERAVRPQSDASDLELLLVRPDVTTAQRVAEAIREDLGVVAEAIDPRHYQEGFHSTATIGTHGAAMAVARLLGLDAAAATAYADLSAEPATRTAAGAKPTPAPAPRA